VTAPSPTSHRRRIQCRSSFKARGNFSCPIYRRRPI
jgi:hypothetical protein